MTPKEAMKHPLGKALSAVMRKIDYDYLSDEDYPELVTIMTHALADEGARIMVTIPSDDPGWSWSQ